MKEQVREFIEKRPRTFIIIVLLCAALLLFIGLSNLRRSGTPRLKTEQTSSLIYSSDILAKNVQFLTVVNENTVRFFTGTRFVELNIPNQQITPLTRELALPTVSKVVWTPKGILLETSKSALNERESELRTLAGGDTTENYWFSVRFSDNRISYLPGEADAYFDQDSGTSNYYTLSNSANNQQKIEQHSFNDSQIQELDTIKNNVFSKLVNVSQEGSKYVLASNNQILNADNKKAKTHKLITSDIKKLDGTDYLVFKAGTNEPGVSQPNLQNLYIFNVDTGKVQLVASGVISDFAVYQGNVTALTNSLEGSPVITTVDVPNNKQTNSVLQGDKQSISLVKSIHIINLQPLKLFVTTSSQNLMNELSSESSIKNKSVQIQLTPNLSRYYFSQPDYFIQYNASSDQFLLSLNPNKTTTELAPSVIKFLKDSGVSQPDYYPKQWLKQKGSITSYN